MIIHSDNKRSCETCKKMLPYEDFDYFDDPTDIDDEDFYHLQINCKSCHDLNIERDRKRFLAEAKAESLKVKEVEVTHAPGCPFCGKKSYCGCRETDGDGYGYGK